jgi:hypothetical protein
VRTLSQVHGLKPNDIPNSPNQDTGHNIHDECTINDDDIQDVFAAFRETHPYHQDEDNSILASFIAEDTCHWL